ncbi:DUF2513 domain-containing protein [Pseudomonas sp. Marseille-P8916]|uniref:DUF2513 domain-containing protein n=1 Tax=Pseudomonas sp. Marseille-P8916 TaxID=2866589 RepID=UPI001CE41C11|nr:DUF2513 domain-containing protein [Pseudomonas sp. Marseille-P8916]
MRRNLKLVEQILSWMEECAPLNGSLKEEIREGVLMDNAAVVSFDYHLDLLVGGGFISRESFMTGAAYYQLTWQGHDLAGRLRVADGN